MDSSKERFKSKFREIFGIDFMFDIPKDIANFGDYAIISKNSEFKIFNVEDDIFSFSAYAPEGYFLCGFYNNSNDNSNNNWTFYYCKSNSKEKIYFKMPYSGQASEAENIKNKLNLFKDFEDSALHKVKEIVIIDSSGNGLYKISYGFNKECDANYSPEKEDYEDIIKKINE
jgi:hypothetical protein